MFAVVVVLLHLHVAMLSSLLLLHYNQFKAKHERCGPQVLTHEFFDNDYLDELQQDDDTYGIYAPVSIIQANAHDCCNLKLASNQLSQQRVLMPCDCWISLDDKA